MSRTQPVVTEDYIPEVREPVGYRRSEADIAFELREILADARRAPKRMLALSPA